MDIDDLLSPYHGFKPTFRPWPRATVPKSSRESRAHAGSDEAVAVAAPKPAATHSSY